MTKVSHIRNVYNNYVIQTRAEIYNERDVHALYEGITPPAGTTYYMETQTSVDMTLQDGTKVITQ